MTSSEAPTKAGRRLPDAGAPIMAASEAPTTAGRRLADAGAPIMAASEALATAGRRLTGASAPIMAASEAPRQRHLHGATRRKACLGAIAKKSVHFSICACHPCAGAMLIFSVSFQFYRMIPEGNPHAVSLLIAIAGNNTPIAKKSAAEVPGHCSTFADAPCSFRVEQQMCHVLCYQPHGIH